ncbi:MAG: hypothetical protein ACRC7P_01640 [Enterovibrio sp.]
MTMQRVETVYGVHCEARSKKAPLQELRAGGGQALRAKFAGKNSDITAFKRQKNKQIVLIKIRKYKKVNL